MFQISFLPCLILLVGAVNIFKPGDCDQGFSMEVGQFDSLLDTANDERPAFMYGDTRSLDGTLGLLESRHGCVRCVLLVSKLLLRRSIRSTITNVCIKIANILLVSTECDIIYVYVLQICITLVGKSKNNIERGGDFRSREGKRVCWEIIDAELPRQFRLPAGASSARPWYYNRIPFNQRDIVP